MLSSLFDNALLGLATAASPTNILYCFIGVTLGTFIGVIPGIGALTAISLLIPITFHIQPLEALEIGHAEQGAIHLATIDGHRHVAIRDRAEAHVGDAGEGCAHRAVGGAGCAREGEA